MSQISLKLSVASLRWIWMAFSVALGGCGGALEASGPEGVGPGREGGLDSPLIEAGKGGQPDVASTDALSLPPSADASQPLEEAGGQGREGGGPTGTASGPCGVACAMGDFCLIAGGAGKCTPNDEGGCSRSSSSASGLLASACGSAPTTICLIDPFYGTPFLIECGSP
jgi:hypothetical protein